MLTRPEPLRPRPRPEPLRPRPRPEASRPRLRPRPSKIGLETSRDRDRPRDFSIPGVHCVDVQLIEAQRDVQQRDRMIDELRSTCEAGKVTELQTDSMLQSLRQKLAEYEAAFGDVEGAAGRSELTIVTLQQQASESQRHIIELESQHRSVLICLQCVVSLGYCIIINNIISSSIISFTGNNKDNSQWIREAANNNTFCVFSQFTSYRSQVLVTSRFSLDKQKH